MFPPLSKAVLWFLRNCFLLVSQSRRYFSLPDSYAFLTPKVLKNDTTKKLKQTVRNESAQCQSNDSCECPGCFVVHLGTLDQISKTVVTNQHLCRDHTDDTAAESQPDTGEDIRNCEGSTTVKTLSAAGAHTGCRLHQRMIGSNHSCNRIDQHLEKCCIQNQCYFGSIIHPKPHQKQGCQCDGRNKTKQT